MKKGFCRDFRRAAFGGFSKRRRSNARLKSFFLTGFVNALIVAVFEIPQVRPTGDTDARRYIKSEDGLSKSFINARLEAFHTARALRRLEGPNGAVTNSPARRTAGLGSRNANSFKGMSTGTGLMSSESKNIRRALSAKNIIFRELTLKVPVLLQRTAFLTLTLALVTRLLGLDRPFVVGGQSGMHFQRKLFSFVRDRAVLGAAASALKEIFRRGVNAAACVRCSPQRVASCDRHKLNNPRFLFLPEELEAVCAPSRFGPPGLAVIRPISFSVRHA